VPDWTRRFFGVPGLNAPMQADLQNRQLGGWRQYSHSLASSAWLAHHFHLHWRMSDDAGFLRDRAYPYLSDVCLYIEGISAERDERGMRTVALSSSPEIHHNEPCAWFEEWTNYDLGLFRWCLGAAAEMADVLADTEGARRWRSVLAELPEIAVDADDVLLVTPSVSLPESHRHFSHAMALHPLDMLRPLDNDRDARIANATLDQLHAFGPGKWMGYSYAWFAALLARAGRGDEAAEALRIYQQAFTFPNGFHTNGDWLGQGRCDIVFGVFTLEGNSAAATAVHEMLLQSRPGALRVFPALPKSWTEARFERLLADGGIEVSAKLESGQVEVRLHSRRDRTIEIAFGVERTSRSIVLSANEPVTLRSAWVT
jgi:alpha-L-fucosidase 2